MKGGLESCGVCSYTTALNNRGAQHLSCSGTHSLRSASNITNYNLNTCVRASLPFLPFRSAFKCALLCLSQYIVLSLTSACVSGVCMCVCVCVCVSVNLCPVTQKKKKKKRKVKHPTLSSSKTVFLCTHNCPPTIATNLWVYFSPSAREYFTICVSICITNTPPPPPSSSPLSAAGYLHVIIPNLRWKKKKLLRITLLFAKSPLDQIAKLAELHYNTKSNCI